MEIHGKSCRLCLCKCENPTDLLIDTDFAKKVMDVFPKVQITAGNGLPNVVCDYCYNMIDQFYGYFESVNAIQKNLLKLAVVIVPKVEVFAEPIEMCADEKVELEVSEMKDDDTEWLDDGVEDEAPANVTTKARGRPSKIQTNPESVLVKEEFGKLNYFELQQLPLNYTTSYRCRFCKRFAPHMKKFKTKDEVKLHILKNHLKKLRPKQRWIKAKTETTRMIAHCDSCQKPIKSSTHSEALEDHKFIHYDIKPYQCYLCLATTHTKDSLIRHMTQHVAQTKRLKCFHCIEDFSSTEQRQSHIRHSHRDKMITCDLCGEKLMSKNLTKIHFREHLSQRLTFTCDRCPGGIRFPDERVLALHLQRHAHMDTQKKPFSCYLCEQKFNSNSMFKRHMKHHAEGKIKACHICGKSVQMSTHALVHLKKPQTYKCDKCGEEFKGRYGLTIHMKKLHDANCILSCYQCGKMIPEYKMKSHLKYCNTEELKCTHCPMTFTKESARQLHNNKVHTGFKCKRCNIIFENRTQMDFHQRYDEYHVRTKSKKKIQPNKRRNLSNK